MKKLALILLLSAPFISLGQESLSLRYGGNVSTLLGKSTGSNAFTVGQQIGFEYSYKSVDKITISSIIEYSVSGTKLSNGNLLKFHSIDINTLVFNMGLSERFAFSLGLHLSPVFLVKIDGKENIVIDGEKISTEKIYSKVNSGLNTSLKIITKNKRAYLYSKLIYNFSNIQETQYFNTKAFLFSGQIGIGYYIL